MNICHHCGATLGPEDRFCGHCGKPVAVQQSSLGQMSFDLPQMEMQMPSWEKGDERPRGILFTNTEALARKLRVMRADVQTALNRYAQQVEPQVRYTLLDAAGTQGSDWRAYHRLLHQNRQLSMQGAQQYVFIIGGEDVVPVPMMRNCMSNASKELVPTDILYGYTITTFAIGEEDVNTLFRGRQRYHVGRLPLGTDATFNQLQGYLARASRYMEKGIPVQMAYGQCDPHWKRVSKEVMADVNAEQLLPDIQASEAMVYEKLFLTPYVTCEPGNRTIDQAFNRYGNLYYFNMHGSGNPDYPWFMGFSIEGNKGHRGIDPQSLSRSKYENIVVTEACFGGKYINLPTDKSMLLTAIHSSTLIYVGSSVVAWGTVDQGFQRSGQISSADIMAKDFIGGLMQGDTAGEAIFRARRHLFNTRQSQQSIPEKLTIFEFSLYGDPALKARFPRQRPQQPIKEDRLSGTPLVDTYHIEEIYNEQPTSILGMVRSHVDRSLQELNDRIQQQLRDAGFQPRKLASVNQVRFGQLSQQLFTYETETGEQPVVVVDNYSKETTILWPKGEMAQPHQAATRLNIDYDTIFRTFSNRFGLIPVEESEQPMLDSISGRTKTVYIDRRIEPKSKRQVRTFNAVLDTVYRPRMEQNSIASLATKTCDFDFSLLINPLAIILETELQLGLLPYLGRQGAERPSKPTFGTLVEFFRQHARLLQQQGIGSDFIQQLSGVTAYRNTAAHAGGITEEKFLRFYDLFASIVTSAPFEKVLELKQKYQ